MDSDDSDPNAGSNGGSSRDASLKNGNSNGNGGDEDDDDPQIKAQNQVALILVCELLDTAAGLVSGAPADAATTAAALATSPPPIIIATTHLKATKNAKGERYRVAEANQLLSAVWRAKSHLDAANRPPAVLITVRKVVLTVVAVRFFFLRDLDLHTPYCTPAFNRAT